MEIKFKEAGLHAKMGEALEAALKPYETWLITSIQIDDETGHRRITIDIRGWDKVKK